VVGQVRAAAYRVGALAIGVAAPSGGPAEGRFSRFLVHGLAD
jgi:hypothetical protein